MQHRHGKVHAAPNSTHPKPKHGIRVEEKRGRPAGAEGAAAPTALIIEPQPASRARIRRQLEREGIAVAEAEDGLTGWNVVRQRKPDLILSSLQSRGLGGIDLLKRVRATSDLPIILYTATPDVAAAVEATKLGAQDVLLVPSELGKLIERARTLLTQNAARDLNGLEEQIIGKNPRMQRVREQVLALSSLRVPVLIYGEPGTGRDHIVRTLHAKSGDRGGDLLVVRDSGSLPARKRSLLPRQHPLSDTCSAGLLAGQVGCVPAWQRPSAHLRLHLGESARDVTR